MSGSASASSSGSGDLVLVGLVPAVLAFVLVGAHATTIPGPPPALKPRDVRGTTTPVPHWPWPAVAASGEDGRSMPHPFVLCDVFAAAPLQGNQLGVFTAAERLPRPRCSRSRAS